MERDTQTHVTILTVETVAYDIESDCPCCGRPRDFRRLTDGSTICGTGQDAGREMGLSDDCWTCRAAMDR